MERYSFDERTARRLLEALAWVEARRARGDVPSPREIVYPHRHAQEWFRITSNDGGGAYTVRQRTWSESSGALADAAAGEHDYAALDLTGYDLRGSADGAADQDVAGWWVWTGTDWTLILDLLNSPEGLAAQIGIEVAVTKIVDIDLGDNNVHYYTLDSAHRWDGRKVWVSELYHAGAPGFEGAWLPIVTNTGTPSAFVVPFAGDVEYGGEMRAILRTTDGDDFDAWWYIDFGSAYELKLKVQNASGDHYQLFLHAQGTVRKDSSAPDISAPD